MHFDHHDLQPPPPAIISTWEVTESEIRPEVFDHLKNLAEAIRTEFRGYEDNDDSAVEEARLVQIRLVNGVEKFNITEYEVEKFIATLEDNTVLKETLRMLYGDRIKLIASLKVYRAEVDALMNSSDPGLARFLSLLSKTEICGPHPISPELEKKLERARKKTGLIIGPGLYPMDDHLARYTTPHFPPSPELGEHGVPLHTPEEAPLPPERGNHGGSLLWRLLQKFISTSDNTSAPH